MQIEKINLKLMICTDIDSVSIDLKCVLSSFRGTNKLKSRLTFSRANTKKKPAIATDKIAL